MDNIVIEEEIDPVDTGAIFLGKPIEINDSITIHIPTLKEVLEVGQDKYMGTVRTICATPTDIKWQLYDKFKIYWHEIGEYDCFLNFLSISIDNDISRLIFGEDFDFRKMKKVYDENIKEYVLVQQIFKVREEILPINENMKQKLIQQNKPLPSKQVVEKNYQIRIDRFVYNKIVNTLRVAHFLTKNTSIPGNKFMIELALDMAKEEYEEAKQKKKENSQGTIEKIISYLVVEGVGNYNLESIQSLNMYTLFALFKQSLRNKRIDLLQTSGYSGFGIDLKKVNKKDLDYLGDE